MVVKFDQRHGSSDGGAILLKGCDERLGLTDRLARDVVDTRQAGKVEHTIRELIRQGVFAIACGYADCNDAARLTEDPMQKLMLGRDPIRGAGLASQPTLSPIPPVKGANTLFWDPVGSVAFLVPGNTEWTAAAARLTPASCHPESERRTKKIRAPGGISRPEP